MGHRGHNWGSPRQGSRTRGRAASGCLQLILNLSRQLQQQQQHGASRNGTRERKSPISPRRPAAGLGPGWRAGQWGLRAAQGDAAGLKSLRMLLPCTVRPYIAGKGGGSLLKLWMRRAIHLLCCSAGLCASVSSVFLAPGVPPWTLCYPRTAPALAWIQPACISQCLCFRYHLFLGCPTCSKDKEQLPVQRSQCEKQGFKKKKKPPKPLHLWEHHINLFVPHKQSNIGEACPCTSVTGSAETC